MTLEKKKYKALMNLFLCSVFTLLLVFFLFRGWENNNSIDLISYEEELLDIELRDYIDEVSGEVNKNEQFATVRLKIKPEYEESVEALLASRCGNGLDVKSYTIPGYQGHEYAKEINDSSIQSIFVVMMEGKWAKTRAIEIYVTKNEKQEMYVYIMG